MLSVFLKTCTLCESPRLQTHGHFLDIGSSTAISAESRGRCRSSRARRQTAFRDSVPASVLARAPRGPLPAPRLVVLEHAPVPGGGAWSPKPPLCISLASERVLSVAFAPLLPRAAPTLTCFARVSSPGCVWISIRSRGEGGGCLLRVEGTGVSVGDRGVCRLRRSLEEKPRALLPIFFFPIKPLTICLWDVRGDLRGHHGSRTLPLTPTDGARVKRR